MGKSHVSYIYDLLSLKSRGVNMLDHPNARTCWPKVRLDHAEMQTVFVIETDLALLPGVQLTIMKRFLPS